MPIRNLREELKTSFLIGSNKKTIYCGYAAYEKIKKFLENYKKTNKEGKNIYNFMNGCIMLILDNAVKPETYHIQDSYYRININFIYNGVKDENYL